MLDRKVLLLYHKQKLNIKEEVYTIYQKALLEHSRLEEEIKSLKSQIDKLPEGHLISSRTGNHYKWYKSDGHNKTYIPKSEQQLKEKLAVKKYLSCKLERLQEEEKAIQIYLNQYQNNVQIIPNPEELLNKESRYHKLLSPHIHTFSEELEEWVNQSYEKNPKNKEKLKFKTMSGNYVRSKSEVIIDSLLFKYGIPFRYECQLDLGRHKVYPDFTICHPITKKIYYWEHLGMMDDEKYIETACDKIKEYARNGIIPSVNLILTYETSKDPLNIDLVESMIKYYFVNDIN